MFVKKIPRWKIKRFIKGFIRSILFFVVISSFCFTAYADVTYPSDGVYDSFDKWVGIGTIDYLLRASNSEIIKSGSFYAGDVNVNEMRLASNDGPFDHVRITVGTDSPHVQRSFKAGDVIVLRQFIAVYMANGVVNDKFDDKFTISVTYQTPDYGLRTVEFRGKNCLKSGFYYEYDHGISVFYDVNLSGVLSSEDGIIKSISYHFYEVASNNYNFVVYPSYPSDGSSNSSPMTYYVGDQSSAPLYPNFDNSTSNELKDVEDDLLGGLKDSFDAWDLFLYGIPSAVDNVMNWLRSASSVFGIFYNNLPWHFQPVFLVLLCLGTFSFILGITHSIISRFGGGK